MSDFKWNKSSMIKAKESDQKLKQREKSTVKPAKQIV